MSPDQPGQPGDAAEPQGAEERSDDGLDLARRVMRSFAGAPVTKRPRSFRPRAGGPGGPRRTGPQMSGAHPDERDPQLLDLTMGGLVAERGWALDLRVRGVFARWPELVGEEIAAHAQPESFTDGRLVVRTDATAWAVQLRLLVPRIRERLDEELGAGTVTAVEVLGPVGPTWKRGRRSVRGARGPRDTYG